MLSRLTPNQVHVWTIQLLELRNDTKFYYKFLSDAEQLRAKDFLRSDDENRFVIGRGILRLLLSAYTDLPFQSIQLSYGQYGKPYLITNDIDLNIYFNLSHSCDVILMAFSLTHQVGIDVEYIRPNINWQAVSEISFSVPEKDSINALSDEHLADYFYRYWTRKEAFTKAIGHGLNYPLENLDISLDLNQPRIINHQKSDFIFNHNWYIWSLPPIENYASAISTQGVPDTIEYFNWNETHKLTEDCQFNGNDQNLEKTFFPRSKDLN